MFYLLNLLACYLVQSMQGQQPPETLVYSCLVSENLGIGKSVNNLQTALVHTSCFTCLSNPDQVQLQFHLH